MNIVASDTALPHFFLVAFRAPPGQVFDATAPNAEEVGAIVLRARVGFDGAAAEPGDVLLEDEPYADLPEGGPFRMEAEIAAWKAEPDVVVVDRLEDVLTPAQQADLGPPPDTEAIADHLAASSFGSVAVDRGSGFGPAAPRPFGWLERGRAPRLGQAGRRGGAGDASSLEGFEAEEFDLPDEYDNAFQNGQPLAGQTFGPGDKLRFTDTTGPVTDTTLTIPAAPVLTVSQDGQPLDPPLALVPRVDTVVMDREHEIFTLVWRATFPWDPRLEAATLEIA